jgi:hypothetical protein
LPASGFDSNGLEVAFMDGTDRNQFVVLTRDFIYCRPETGELIVVPAGYGTDGLSLPKAIKWIINPVDPKMRSAVVHDWLYAVGEPNKRKNADQIFRDALKQEKVSWIQRNLAYAGVRVGGGAAYGSPAEWARFGSPVDRKRSKPAFTKPHTAIVGRLNGCAQLRDAHALLLLHQKYNSLHWPLLPLGPD